MMGSLLRPDRPSTRLCALLAALAIVTLHGCGDDLGECKGPFCVTPPERPDPSTIAAGPGNGQHGFATQPLPEPLGVMVTDSDGRAVAGVSVTFSVSTGGGRLSSPSAQSDNLGLAQVNWILGPEIGVQRVLASAADSNDVQLNGSPVELSADAAPPQAAKLVLRPGLPDTAQNSVPLEQQPIVDVLDVNDQPIAGVEVTVSVASGGGVLTGTTGATSDESGAAAFTGLALSGPQGAQILRFNVAAPALEVSSGPIQLVAGTPASMTAVEPVTYEATVGSPVSPGPSVLVKDAAGNGVSGVPVSFTPSRNAAVSPETATTNEQGIAQVSWTLGTTANVQYSLTARIEASPVLPVRFTATARAGAAGRLRISTQPSSSTASGTPFAQQPVLQIADENGNPTAQPGIVVTAAISSGPTGTLANPTATTDANGQAAFSGLSVTGVAGNYTLSFSAPGLAGITSAPFAITVGAAAGLAFTRAPSTAARSRAPLVIQPILQIQDASGNPIRQGSVPITVSALPSGTIVSGETVTTDETGRAPFTALTLQGTPGPKDLTFSAPGLQSITARVTLPAVITVSAAPTHPVSALVGTTLPGPVISWTFRDAASRPVADADFTLMAPQGGTAAAAAPFSDINGVVQAVNWTLGPTAGYQYLELRLPDGRVFRDSIVATPDAAANLIMVSGDNQTAATGSELPDLLIVRTVDRYTNGVGNVDVQWSTCDGAAGPVITSDANGYSSVKQPTGSQPSGDTPFCTIASVAGLADTVRFHYTVTPGASPPPSALGGVTAAESGHSGPPPSDPRTP
jgi:hypothetical protein